MAKKTTKTAKAASSAKSSTKSSAQSSAKAAPKFSASSSAWPKASAWGTENVAQNVAQNVESLFKSFPQAPAGFGFDQAKEQLGKLGVLKGCEDAAQAGKCNMDAAIKSSQIFAKAAEEMSKAIYGFTQSSVELGVQASQAMLGVKTLKDLVDVQSEYAKNSLDHLITGTSKISDMAVKVANEAIEPISQRVNETIEKMHKVA